jgi:hypothetical protein
MRIVSTAARTFLVFGALAALLGLGVGGARASKPAHALFALSPIEAASLPAQAATRYSVSAAGVPLHNAPTYSWTLHLSAAGAGCDDSVLQGGRRLGAGEYLWVNQGASFVWYHGAAGSYSSDRGYGCDQARIGAGGYPGTLSVVAENEYEHCSASYAGVPSAPKPGRGPAASCALGGYSLAPTTLPVPARLLALYRKLAGELSALVSSARRGSLRGAALAAALAPILRAQQSAFAQLFPPVWGCGFNGLFDEVVLAKQALDGDVGLLASGQALSGSELAAGATDVQRLASSVGACAAPRAALAAVERLSSGISALRARAGSGANGRTLLESGLPALGGSFDSVVGNDFPTVFGMRFIDLVDRTLAEDAALGAAEHGRGARSPGEAVSELQRVLGPEQTIGKALVRQAKHVVAVEIKNS